MQATENALFHRHLVLAYAFTWALQLSYLGYVLVRHLQTKRKSAGDHGGLTF